MKDLTITVEDNVEEDSGDLLPFKYSITSCGADYPVDGLVKRMNNSSIYVPIFQRGYVWKLKGASRFIESLMIGLSKRLQYGLISNAKLVKEKYQALLQD